MSTSHDSELRAGFERALESDPQSLPALINLMDLYREDGDATRARQMATRALAADANQPAVIAAVARLLEGEHRSGEALSLIRDGGLHLNAHAPVFPLYLRLLLEEGRYEEVVLEARRGFETIWRVDSLLTIAVAMLHFKDPTQAAQYLDLVDWSPELRGGARWVSAIQRSQSLGTIRDLVDLGVKAQPASAGTRRLAELLG
jgi:hypothetical protein